MRVLATAAFSFAAAIFAANYLLPESVLLPGALLFAAAGLALLCLRRRWLRGVVLALIAFGVGLGFFRMYDRHTAGRAALADGETLYITGEVLEYPQLHEDSCRVRISLKTEGLAGLDALLYDSGMTLAAAEPGQTVAVEAKLSAADKRWGEEYDAYNAKGVYLTASARADPELRPGRPLAHLPARIARAVSGMIDRLFPADTSPFLRSLMLGDKSELYADEGQTLALSRAGLMHLAAVSGMHIAFLVELLQLILGRTRRSSLLCIALVWLFVLATGAQPSAVRAGVMQSLLVLAPAVRRENDPVTSLSAALALILLGNPHAAASVSLQLSFAAMAGLLCFSERLNDALLAALPEGRVRDLLRGSAAVAASSLSVMAFTVPLTAVHFGTVSLLAPVCNILCLPVVSLCFCGAYLSCALAALFWPLGAAAAWLTAWTARYILLAARLISAVPFACVYIRGPFLTVWLGLCYAFALIAALSRASVRFRLLFPAALSAAALALCLVSAKVSYASGRGVVSVLDVGQGQCISVFSGERTLMIDCGGLWSGKNAGETAGAYLSACGREGVDVLLLTHLHADHANGVTMLLEMTKVGQLWLPERPNDEDGLLEEILQSAREHRVPVRYVREDTALELGGLRVQLYAPGQEGGENERCVMAAVSLGDYDMLVTADAPKSAERELVEKKELHDMELLIAGHHGSRYACSGELLGSIGADTAVISVGYNNFGHPTYETLERLAAYGYSIWRTDLNGTVEIRVG